MREHCYNTATTLLQYCYNTMPPKTSSRRGRAPKGTAKPRSSSTVLPPLPSMKGLKTADLSEEDPPAEARVTTKVLKKHKEGPAVSAPPRRLKAVVPVQEVEEDDDEQVEEEEEEVEEPEYLPDIERVEESEEEESEEEEMPSQPPPKKPSKKSKSATPATTPAATPSTSAQALTTPPTKEKDRPYHKSQMTMEEKEAIVEWWQQHEGLYNPCHKYGRNTKWRNDMVREKATEMGISPERIHTFMRSARTQFGKITCPDRKPSGSGVASDEEPEVLSEANEWLKNKLAFMSPHIKRLKAPRRSVSQKLLPPTSTPTTSSTKSTPPALKRQRDPADESMPMLSDDDLLLLGDSSDTPTPERKRKTTTLASTLETLQSQISTFMEATTPRQKEEREGTPEAAAAAFGRTCAEAYLEVDQPDRLQVYMQVLNVFNLYHKSKAAPTPSHTPRPAPTPAPAPAPAPIATPDLYYQPTWYDIQMPSTPQPTQWASRWPGSPPRMPLPTTPQHHHHHTQHQTATGGFSTPSSNIMRSLAATMTASEAAAITGTTTTAASGPSTVTVTVTSSTDDSYPAVHTPVLEVTETHDDGDDDDAIEDEDEDDESVEMADADSSYSSI